MSANIFGERFLGHREPAWHNLGRVFEEPLSATEAVVSAGVDFTVDKHPVFCYVDGDYRRVPNRVALVRPALADAEEAIFGIVSEDYKVVQNIDIARIIDPLTKDWPVETVGALGKGETMFLTLDAGFSEVAGDEIHRYFLVTDTKTGGKSLRVAFTPIRVVCQNTLSTGIARSTASMVINHLHDPAGELELARSIIHAANKVQDDVEAAFRHLAEVHVEDALIRRILEEAYPMPTAGRMAAFRSLAETLEDSILLERVQSSEGRTEYYTGRVEAYREGAQALYEKFCVERPNYAGTPWAMYNAIVECEDYRRGAASVDESLLFGYRAKTKSRAFDIALQVAG